MIDCKPEIGLFGRRRIYTDSDVITSENVLDEVNKALVPHMENLKEEEYLHWYRRGVQPILERTKKIRSDICSKVVINNADMIATFKNGYFLTKPATYISRRESEEVTRKVKELNEYVANSGKYEADNDVVDSFHTVGYGVLFVEPNDEDDTPFLAYSLDPRSAFVTYSTAPGNRPTMGINIVVQNRTIKIDVFTDDSVYRLSGRSLSDTEVTAGYNPDVTALHIDSIEPNLIGEIPIIEYRYNKLYMGAFESTIPIQDSINLICSNRNDGIEQFIQSLMVLYNCELDEGTTANDIRRMGFIALKNSGENKASLDIISQQLDQSQTEITLNDLYDQMLDKAGMPSLARDSASTSDTGTAVYLRNGWATADTCARNTEDEFKKSNAYFDRVILAILKRKKNFELNRSDFELKIVRNDMSNLLVKTQAAMNMKELGFAPALAFERSGLSNDPLTDVEVSKEYIERAWTAEEPKTVEPGEDITQTTTGPQDRLTKGDADVA